ncbi:DUF4224 domain-containing protein [Shigella boydii]|uniref:DUF4224 domain-containing protein n=1 Tax=Shigella boydii TaxID=621 RepID=UPI00287AADB0|nr:DUF4224 domain-containing protein [Shigella boydii]MDS1444462.1 DUF4224 domain-containing protein [Shigella boydii]MDS1447555.1 DUF4224 domain-containing protein [Shigella boydii]MDS1480440.1 DUF4224 domain-containing protein [Shigella boydii]
MDWQKCSGIKRSYLTGCKYASHQRKWLMENGLPFYTNRSGKPIVSRDLFTCNKTLPPREVEPNFGAI